MEKKIYSYDEAFNASLEYFGGVYDKRPCKGEGFINDKTYGVYIETASNISLRDVKVNNSLDNYGGEVKKINVR